MTPEEIYNGNKLIDVFMGWAPEAPPKSAMYIDWKPSSKPVYHLSWGALMQVIEKIESMGYVFTIKENTASITTLPNNEMKMEYPRGHSGRDHNSKIEACYYMVIKFISRYNLLTIEK